VLFEILTYCDVYTVVSFLRVISHICARIHLLILILRSANSLELPRYLSRSGAHYSVVFRHGIIS
jgi:hypothetical protein